MKTMTINQNITKWVNRTRQAGFAAIEMLWVTPVILLMIFGVIEVSQILQAYNIMVGMSREAANLVSRSTTYSAEQIMTIVATTSGTLDMQSDGIIYITHISGRGDDAPPVVTEQFVWSLSGAEHVSEVWDQCVNWVDDSCVIDEDEPPQLLTFPIDLNSGESVYAVEVFYNFVPLSNYIFDSSFTISDTTYL